MLTDNEIEEKARQRIAEMPISERMEMEAKIRTSVRYSHQSSKEGYRSLPKADRRAYYEFQSKELLSSGGGDYAMHEIECEMKERLNASREEIAAMKKNPFVSKVIKLLIITAVVSIGGVLLTALIGKLSGVDMGVAYIGVGSTASLLSLRWGDQLVKSFRFRKLQKAYENPEFQEQEIDAAVFRIMKENVMEKMKREEHVV